MESIRLHFKILTPPAIPIETLVANMRQVYAQAGIRVDVMSTENLNLPDLNDIRIKGCPAATLTPEHTTLFSNRNNAGADDIVVYFVRSTSPPYAGCATHPPGRPGAIVVKHASQWALAHEVGHVLGLSHVGGLNRLMTGGGTANITNPPPDLIPSEHQTMLASGLTSPIP